MRYDREADILMLEADKSAKIDYAHELGDVIVHFTKDNLPVLVEILNASRVLKQKGLLGKLRAEHSPIAANSADRQNLQRQVKDEKRNGTKCRR